MKPVLIAHVSPAGSTREIAGHLKTAFEALNRPVELSELVPGIDLGRYSGIVVAAPVHGMRWLPEAVAWVELNRTALKAHPLALVAVSYIYFEGRASWQKAILKNLEVVRRPSPHASLQVFGGRLPGPLPAPARWLFGVKAGRPTNLVDPAAIAGWVQAWAPSLG